jgi:hypothetical protein
MPKRGPRAAEKPSRKITFGNQRINHLQCGRDSKICHSEEKGGTENLFENTRWKTPWMRTQLKRFKNPNLSDFK